MNESLKAAREAHKQYEDSKIKFCLGVLSKIERFQNEQRASTISGALGFISMLEEKKTCRKSLVSFWRIAVHDFELARKALTSGIEFDGVRLSPGEVRSSFPFFIKAKDK